MRTLYGNGGAGTVGQVAPKWHTFQRTEVRNLSLPITHPNAFYFAAYYEFYQRTGYFRYDGAWKQLLDFIFPAGPGLNIHFLWNWQVKIKSVCEGGGDGEGGFYDGKRGIYKPEPLNSLPAELGFGWVNRKGVSVATSDSSISNVYIDTTTGQHVMTENVYLEYNDTGYAMGHYLNSDLCHDPTTGMQVECNVHNLIRQPVNSFPSVVQGYMNDFDAGCPGGTTWPPGSTGPVYCIYFEVYGSKRDVAELSQEDVDAITAELLAHPPAIHW